MLSTQDPKAKPLPTCPWRLFTPSVQASRCRDTHKEEKSCLTSASMKDIDLGLNKKPCKWNTHKTQSKPHPIGNAPDRCGCSTCRDPCRDCVSLFPSPLSFLFKGNQHHTSTVHPISPTQKLLEHAFEVQVPWCLGTEMMVVVVIGFVTRSSDSYFSVTVNVPQVIELTSDSNHGHTVLLFPRNNIFKSDKGLSDKGPAMGMRMTQVAKRPSQCG